MASRGTGRVLGSGCIALILTLEMGCAVVRQQPVTHPGVDVATRPEGRRSVPASHIVAPSLAMVQGVALREPSGAKRQVVVHARFWTHRTSTNDRLSRVRRAAHLVERSGTAIAERPEVSLAN